MKSTLWYLNFFFGSSLCPWQKSGLLSIAVVHYFSWQSSIPLNYSTTICLFILLLMGIWVVSSLGLLWMKLLKTFSYLTFALILLDKNLRLQWLGRTVNIIFSFNKHWKIFFQSGCFSYTPGNNIWEFQLFHIFANAGFCRCF